MLTVEGIIRHLYRHRRGLLAYGLPATLAVIAAQTWFRYGTVIATGDLAPPVVAGSDYISHWNQLTSGEGTPSFDITWLPYFELMRGLHAFGVGEELFQRLWLSGLFAGSAAAVAFFTLSLLGSPLTAAVAGTFSIFNAYRLVTVPDHIPLAATIVGAVLGGFIIRAGLRQDSPPRVVTFALVSVGVGFVFTNPPHVLILLFILAASLGLTLLSGGRGGLWASLRFLLRAAPVVLLLNLWWLVPTALTTFEPGFADRYAVAGGGAWEWTHRRATLLNALTLNTAWGWTYPEYFPFAAELDESAFAPLRFVLPGLALFGVIAARRRHRRAAIGLLAIALTAAWIAKGVNPPLEGATRWLYDNVPGYWLLRDPAKALIVTTLAFSVLAAITVTRLSKLQPGRTLFAGIVGGTVLLASVAYAHPLFTGRVIPDQRPLLPPAHVRIPEAWHDLADYLNRQNADGGKVLVLPTPDFYQLPTRWGYYGVPFARLAIHRPVFEQRGSYLTGTRAVQYLRGSIERDLIFEQGGSVLPKLRALGVRYVLVRGDVDTSFPGRRLADSQQLVSGLSGVLGLEHLDSFGTLELYRLAGEPNPEIFPAVPLPLRLVDLNSLEVLSSLPPGFALTEPGTDSAASHTFQDPSRVVLSPGGNLQVFRVEPERLWTLTGRARTQGYEFQLADPLQIRLGTQELPTLAPSTIRIRTLQPPFALSIHGSTHLVDTYRSREELGLIRAPKVTTVQVWKPLDRDRIDPHAAGPVRDCNRYDKRAPEEVGLSAVVVEDGGRPALRLAARDHIACVSFPVTNFDPAALYRLEFEYQGVAGSAPRACLWQEGPDRCATLPELQTTPGWHRFDETVQPLPDTTSMRLFFYADGTGGPLTLTEYRHVRIHLYDLSLQRRLSTGEAGLLSQISLPVGLARVDYKDPFQIPSPLDPHAAGPVRDCNRYDKRAPEEVGLSAVVVEDGGRPALRLAARDHIACVSFPVTNFDPAALYRLEFEYQGVAGSAPRACLWQEGPDRCATLPELQTTPGWHRFDETVQPLPDTTSMRLFFYADGTGDLQTVASYRRMTVTPVAPLNLVLLPHGTSASLPRIDYVRQGPAEFIVRITGLEERFLLTLTESFAPGWQLEPTGRAPAEIQHVRVNGFANGWLIRGNGNYLVRLHYAPENVATAARRVSLTSALVLVFTLPIFRRARRHHRTTGHGGSTQGQRPTHRPRIFARQRREPPKGAS